MSRSHDPGHSPDRSHVVIVAILAATLLGVVAIFAAAMSPKPWKAWATGDVAQVGVQSGSDSSNSD